jgi:hypothetical protein
MRPNQQNNNKNRSRGRNNNGGRKHLNPLSRNYESTGPDIKVRGNAAHVAEKYLQLARDAQSTGDSVMAENYLQHAEHYFRIVAAAQAAQNPQRDQFGQATVEYDEDDDFPPVNDRFASPEPPAPRFPPQQPQQQQPYDVSNGQQQSAPVAAEGDAAENSSEPAFVAADAGAEGQAGENGEMPRRHRDRRGRRRGRGAGEGNDPAGSPQPDVGELPAFLTGTPTAAE